MPSGGARARSGPSPDPQALRRDRDSKEWLHLPASGRQGDTPEWPLARPTKRELEIWGRLWKKPQAIAWEAHDLNDEVALYVRSLRDAESPLARAETRTLVLRLMTSLGINEAGLHGNRWVIDDEPAVTPATRTNDPARASAKTRFTTIDGGAA